MTDEPNRWTDAPVPGSPDYRRARDQALHDAPALRAAAIRDAARAVRRLVLRPGR